MNDQMQRKILKDVRLIRSHLQRYMAHSLHFEGLYGGKNFRLNEHEWSRPLAAEEASLKRLPVIERQAKGLFALTNETTVDENRHAEWLCESHVRLHVKRCSSRIS